MKEQEARKRDPEVLRTEQEARKQEQKKLHALHHEVHTLRAIKGYWDSLRGMLGSLIADYHKVFELETE